MNPSPDLPQFSPEEQARLLARVYAFILSDQFTVVAREEQAAPAAKPARTRKRAAKLQKAGPNAASAPESKA